MASVEIHPTAIVEKGAQLDEGVVVGPYAIIGKDVHIGKGTHVHAHALIQGYTIIGEENEIFSYASIGNRPQDLKYKGEKTLLKIGRKNLIREYVTLQPGTVQDKGETLIGDENLFMAYSHVAHDCIIGNQNIFANATQLAGHVTIQNMTVLGGMSGVHQFVVVGDMALVAGGSLVKQDLPPYCIVDGFRAVLRGINMVALQRRGVSSEARSAIKQAYKAIFLEKHPTVEEAIASLSEAGLNFPEVQKFIGFIRNSKRGVIRPPLVSLRNGEYANVL